jgi:UDP-hydrolysing UDP-N-acetyl-D-glucosamine 2-epimerase
MHLDPACGSTWRRIVDDGFRIAARVPIHTPGDRDIDIARTLARGVDRLSIAFQKRSPDVVLLLGDRIEILAAAAACLPLRIPVAHVHGGESTLGLIDDQIRHAVTKLSHLHFVSTEAYARRLRSMGEEPWRISVSGAAGIEYIRKLEPVPPADLAARLQLNWAEPVFLFTYHPVTLQPERAARDLREVLAAVGSIPGQWIVTGSNSDSGGRRLWRQIQEFSKRPGVRVVDSLGQRAYLSLMSRAIAVVGNSSSGIIEAPSLGIPTVNIGDRQGGRIRGASVIDVAPDRGEIVRAVSKAASAAFRAKAARSRNPYEHGDASATIVRVLARLPDRRTLIEKRFSDPGERR